MTFPTRRASWLVLLVLGVLWPAAAAVAQQPPPNDMVHIWRDADGNEMVGATFADPFTSASEMFVFVYGTDGFLGAGLDVADVDLSQWTPTMPPTDPVSVFWTFDVDTAGNEDVIRARVVARLNANGGFDAVGIQFPPGTFDRIGTIERIEAGSGRIAPDYFLDAYDEFLPEVEDVDQLPDWTLGFSVSGPEGSEAMLPTVSTETTTTTEATPTTTVTTPTTTVTTSETASTTAAANEVGTTAEPEDGASFPWFWLLAALVIGGAIFAWRLSLITRPDRPADPITPSGPTPPEPSSPDEKDDPDGGYEESGWDQGPDAREGSPGQQHTGGLRYDPESGWTGGIDYGDGKPSSPDGGYGSGRPDDGFEPQDPPGTDGVLPDVDDVSEEVVQPDWRKDFRPSSDLGEDVRRLSEPLGPHDEFPSDPAGRESWIRARIRWRLEQEMRRLLDSGARPPEVFDFGADTPIEVKRIAAEVWRELWNLEETQRAILDGDLPEPQPMRAEQQRPQDAEEGTDGPDDGEFEETIL